MVIPPTVAAERAQAAVAASEDDGSVSPEDKALQEAKATGKPVELTSARTELSDTWVNPDGTFSEKKYGAPVRVLRSGVWVATDPTLEFATDGSVKPRATTVVVSFSGGGTGPLLTGVKDGRTLSLSWPSALPKPTLNGNVATYAEVLPGVDLQLKAEVEGFSQLVVVKTPEAADNPALAQLKYTMSTVGVTVATDPATGTVTATNPAGQTVFTSPSPIMWDSTTTGSGTETQQSLNQASAQSLTATEPEAPEPDDSFEQPAGSKEAVMATSVIGSTLQITPDQQLLQAADTTYPVYIDPSWAWGGRNNWTRVSKKYPTKNYLNSNEVARVGYENETNGLSRSFFQMDTANVRGTKVISSTFRIKNVWSWSCQDRPVQLWHTGAIGKQTTWNNQPAKIDWLYNVNDSKGWSDGCPAGNLEFDLTWKMQRVAAAGDTSVTLGMYAANESDTFGWKKFDPKTATLETVYTNPPATPTGLGTNPKTDCATGGLIGNTTVSLHAFVTDPNAGNLSAQFQVFRSDGTLVADEWIPGLKDRVSTLVVPDAKLPSGSYTWKVRAYDQSEYSAWSQTCKFTVDRTRPNEKPAISSVTFPNGENGWPSGTGKARTPGSFTISANGVSDVVWYGYYTDWNPDVKSVTVPAGGSATVQLTPPGVGPHFVYAFSQDPAGNRSDTTAYLFYAGRSVARDQPGDLNGDTLRDIWSKDSFGTLLTYAGQGNAKFSTTTNGGVSGLGSALTTSSLDWGQDGYNDLVTLQRDTNDNIDKLWVYSNNGLGRVRANSMQQINVSCPVRDEEMGCTEEGDDHWQGASQIVNPGDLNGDGRADLLVKQGKRLWAYFGERNLLLDMHGAPVLVGGEDWDKYSVITPGDLNGDGVPDLWLRDNANGDILRTYGKPSADKKAAVDLATWGSAPRTKVGTGVTLALYPEVGSVGDVSGDGVTDLWARKADNTVFGWYGEIVNGAVGSFSGGFDVDTVAGARIASGTTLASGEQFTTNGAKLVMQTDGNLVLFTKGNKPVWATNTAGNQGAFARMQADGALVVYTANGSTTLWSSKTGNKPNSYAVVLARGVLVIYDAVGRSHWTSGGQSRPDYNDDGYTDVLARDANGDMWVYPGTGGTGTSTLGSRYFVGNGWWRDWWTNAYNTDLNNDGYTDIVGRNRNGELHLYPGTDGKGTYPFGSPSLLGVGWNTYDTLGFGDINGDGRTDAIGRDSGGDLWVYPGTGGTGTSTLSSRIFIGNGWWPASWTTIRFADMNGDYKVDIMGRTDQGDLYVYPNTSTNNGAISFGARYFNGNGWWNGHWNPFATDLDSNGSAESVGVTNNGELYDFLPSGRTLVGVGWQSFDVIL